MLSWPVNDASDLADEDMDESADPDGLGERGDRHGGDGTRVGGAAGSNQSRTRRA